MLYGFDRFIPTPDAVIKVMLAAALALIESPHCRLTSPGQMARRVASG